MASNVRSFPDVADFDDYPDWIELHNTSPEAQSLNDYYLSDDPDTPTKWQFPSGSTIAANEYLAVFADGFDVAEGESYQREYWPNSSYNTIRHHTNFKLSSSGETLFLHQVVRDYQFPLPLASTWRYYDAATPPAEIWKTPGFNDSAWSSDTARFGYFVPELTDLATEIDFGDDPANKPITTYFRKKFTVAGNFFSFGDHSITFRYNDGAIIYLNGQELDRLNLGNSVSHGSSAQDEVGSYGAIAEKTIDLPDDLVIRGENIFAVELHQASAQSEDLFFEFTSSIAGFSGFFSPRDYGTETQGKNWSYLGDNTEPDSTWADYDFDDSTWTTGNSPMGYFNGTIIPDPTLTLIDFGDDPANKTITSYFRSNFTIADPSGIGGLRLTLDSDDGAVIYLNGVEVARENLPSGAIDSTTLATDETFDVGRATRRQFLISGNANLVAGDNSIAVEVHQSSARSPAMLFDLTLETYALQALKLIDEIPFSTQVSDVSIGRNPANPDQWVTYASPTPEAPNSGPTVTSLREESTSAEISPAAGLSPDSVSVSISASAGDIYFTLDGSNPTVESSLYSASFELTESTVVRARVFESGKVAGEIVTSTYLIGESFASGLPVLSLSAPPETLFGNQIGIYGAKGAPGGNVHKGVDAPGHLEFFPVDGSEGFAVNGGFRLGGENNWASHAQKAFNFATRGKYGDDAITYDLFPGSGIPKFTALTIREGGDDWEQARLTDGIFEPLTKETMEVEANRIRSAVLFVNGEYWGHYNIRDRWDDNWFFQEYGTNDGAYDRIIAGQSDADNGTRDDWDALYAFISSNDVSDPQIWAFIESRIEIDSLIDFVISESYGRNSSWGGNREWWRDHRPGSKWRWFIPDMDRTFGNTSGAARFDDLIAGETTTQHLANSPLFRARLAQRSAALMASTLSQTRVHGLIDTLGGATAPEIPRQLDRWGRPRIDDYQDALDRMKNFASDRSNGFLAEVANELDLDDAISSNLNKTGEGSFRVAGIPVAAQTLALFPNIEAIIEALPAPGYRFDHWTGITGDAKTTFVLPADQTITAHFVPDSSTETSGTLSSNITFSAANSPYVVTSDLIVPAGVTLTLEPGVVLEFLQGVNLRVIGTLLVRGTAASKVTFQGRHGSTWGGASFEQPTTQSILTHLILRDASRGVDANIYPSAISGLDADVVIDFLDIGASRGPLFFRGGSLLLSDSLIDIPLTGDGLNVKQGSAETLRCTFTGNTSPDTDAIDYDGVIDGIIKDCRIYNFQGFNSDGIDTGEQCVNCLIEGNSLFYNSDKGISVGQGSTVILRNNLIVSCAQGVGVKDAGSTILIDQNTFVDCTEGVAVFEKNFGSGGGIATVTNCIFAGCDQPTTVDALSTLTVAYSLSNTLPLSGPNNLFSDPLFVDAQALDFELQAASPAINSGDPAHALDPNGTRADMGARYTYSPDDYPFITTGSVVINEVLANSGDLTDWIELYNRTNEDIDISGWFLSDDGSQLKKYRIPVGTVITANGFLTFYEDANFGTTSLDPNRLEGFALSDTGETVHLTSAANDQLTQYRFKEKFGPSLEGQTIGSYYKASSDSYNFVAQQTPTRSAQNSSPKNGPIVISEIMYAPAGNSAAEYFELLNISSAPTNLYDTARNAGWRIADGIVFEFPAISPVTLAPGQRLILTRNVAAFNSEFTPQLGTLIMQWTSGKLSNGGETLQLDRPGPLDSSGELTYVRVDRVNYDDDLPWDIGADETGLALSKIVETDYGNDSINWAATATSPGSFIFDGNYNSWEDKFNITDPEGDDDGDQLSNLLEYALRTNPTIPDLIQPLSVVHDGNSAILNYPGYLHRDDLEVSLETSPNLINWIVIPTSPVDGSRQTTRSRNATEFYRINVSLKP
ncbi:MAG: parallel beta-helix repeat protein [Akkermansiaceae bacterium]|jgi:parallel beta-helix repeat protein